MQQLKEKGIIKTEQMKAEKLRKKDKQKTMYEPGTIRYGLAHKQNPIDMMGDMKRRRERKRDEKH